MQNKPIFADRVQESTTVVGTGPVTLGGAASGYQTFESAFTAKGLSAGYCRYCISDSLGNWEVGTGYFDGGTTLDRGTVHSSSTGNALIDFPAGAKTVMLTASADIFGSLPLLDEYDSLSLYLSGLLFTQLANVSLGSTGDWSTAVWNGTIWVAIKLSGAGAWSNDGITWTSFSFDNTGKEWPYLAWNGSVFVVAPNSFDFVYTSADGKSWTKRMLPRSASWKGLAAFGSRFCLIDMYGVLISTNGINWTSQELPGTPYNSACASNGTEVCILTTTGAFLSSDGATWRQSEAVPLSPLGYTYEYVPVLVWTGSEYAGLNGYNELLSSTDGDVWSWTSLPGASTWKVIGGNGVIRVIIANSGTGYLTSRDLINWKARTASMAIQGSAISWNGKEFLFLQNNSSINAIKTLDLTA